MGRRRRGQAIHGWLVIDKAAGMTSAAVVNRARHFLNAAKVGHGGTLDPLATGVLPLAFGEATKTMSYLMDGVKSYRFTIGWGEARDTDDADGEVVATSDVRPAAAAIEAALPRFVGEIEQIPPDYSAVKVDGARAYALARDKKELALQPRTIRIDAFRLVGRPDADHAVFEVTSGKGAYMRSLARDLAKVLGTHGHVSALRRTRLGPFTEDHAISLDKLERLGHSAPAAEYLLPVETALDDIPALALTEDEARRIQCGQAVSALKVAKRSPLKQIGQGAVICAMAEGKPVALARFEGGEIRPFRVLNF
ncbi:MAG: tRNA pseudouridine(55) synthase TruB [Rhodospirillales bacterium]|jgi:tRNA pseudouridine55 synthase|nr:tRNA pseudouridine(55) synthase TruB [Rhodospirillaceae bacterium]MDP6427480.1 tRNA pseudouridine(55) synthase TruB [Rhodospirillales bacterium]MDP6646240.1 tRNA pseudouridine(55) synthase TruB [Rhodospirillales bacterium]MDP6842051.1 tRNA pseudouridine(55) synthase TruB [Rhodospirillales bacterium]|tara:strand:+ start:2091 stop:3017 length:927 start_codon:yes stop_codon:yes gene_type:complete